MKRVMKKLSAILVSLLFSVVLFSQEYPENLLLLGGKNDYAFLVEKKSQRMFVYRADDTEPVSVFTITTGKNNGDKYTEGDEKTPLGVYFFTKILSGKKLPPLYGLKAFVMDYPNPFDLYEGKSGSGIWLHGSDDPLKPLTPYSTRGCVAMRNSDLIKVEPLIVLWRTPIIVEETIKFVDYSKVIKERDYFVRFVEGWRKAWESKNISRYMSYYSKDFSMDGKDYYEYRRFKDRLNRIYRYIKVKLYDLQIVKSSKYVVASFYQEYRSDKKYFAGTKRLYIKREGNSYKIIRESVKPGKLWKKREIVLRGEKLIAVENLSWENLPLKSTFRVKFEILNGISIKRGFYVLVKVFNRENDGVYVIGKRNMFFSDESLISPKKDGIKVFVKNRRKISLEFRYPERFNPERISVELYDLMGVLVFSESLNI